MNVVFKCADCGNLHGARVDACGMCGSQKVALVNDDPPPSSAPSTPNNTELPSGVRIEQLIDALIELAETATAFLWAHTPNKDEDEEADEDPGPHHASHSG